MPKDTNESKLTESPVVSSDADSTSGDTPNVEPTNEIVADTIEPAELESEGTSGVSGDVPEGSPAESDASDGSPEFNLEEVSDPLPESQFTAKDYPGDTPFPSYKTPDGTVFNITTEDNRFQGVSLDGTKRVASTLTDTIDDFHATMNEVYPAKTDPFTGQDVAARLQQGVQGGDPAPEIDAPVPVVEPTVKVHLNYTAFINACSWFPTQINAIGGKIVDDSDAKAVHVLIHDRDDFRAEWSHLLLGPVEVAE